MDQTLQQEISTLRWFHQIDFGNEVLSPGWIKAGKIRRMERAILGPPTLTGKSVLDIGCWDGAYSIAASRLGAARVLATDHCVWNERPGDRRAFDLARKHLAPPVPTNDATPEKRVEPIVIGADADTPKAEKKRVRWCR